MSRATAWFVHLACLAVGGTGLVYGWMCYLVEPADEFAIVNHPWQPALHTAHVVAAPAMVFAVGLLWSSHFAPKWRAGAEARRASGLLLALGFVPLVLSGYLLQTARDDGWRTAWLWIHDVVGGLWVVAYLGHQTRWLLGVSGRRRSTSRGSTPVASGPASGPSP